jgi:hypothetical protein
VFFLNQPDEQLKNGTFILLDVHGKFHQTIKLLKIT